MVYVCNMCSVVRATRQHGLVQTRRPRVSALLPPEPESGLFRTPGVMCLAGVGLVRSSLSKTHCSHGAASVSSETGEVWIGGVYCDTIDNRGLCSRNTAGKYAV